MVAVNITALQNSDSVSGFVCVGNAWTDGVLIGGFIVALFFVMLMVLKRWDFDKAMLASSWSCFLISAIAAYIPCGGEAVLLSPYYALVFLMVAALTALYMWTAGD